MQIHKPERIFGNELAETASCFVCKTVFKVGDGVVYEGGYTKNGQDKYGYVCFCSLSCITTISEAEGNC
jgi:hypothetical protein